MAAQSVNVKDFGALGNGTNDWTAITNAVKSIPSGGGTLVFSAGTYSVTSSLTIPAAVQVVFEEGALLAPTAAAVTINGRIVAHPTQKIFGGTGFNSPVNHSSGSGPAITVAGNPIGNYAINVRIEDTGALGVATFQYSCGIGTTWSVTQTTAATFPIPGTGLTISFPAGPGTYNGKKPGPQDLYSWTSFGAITISPTAFETISVMNFGAIGDGVTPCSDAINAAIISLDPVAGGIVQLGFGTYYLDKQIDVDRAVWLRGMGGSPDYPGTNLLVAPGVTAIRCWSACAPSGDGASCAYLEGFSITPAGHLSTTGTCDFTASSGSISVTAGAPNFANGQLVAIEGVGDVINLPNCTAATTHGSATVTVTVSNDTGHSGVVDGMYVVIGKAFPAPTKVLSVINIGGGVETWTMTSPADPTPAAGDLSGALIEYCFALLARIVSGGGTASVTLDTRAGFRSVIGATITHADAGVELNSRVRIERVHVRSLDLNGFAGPCFVARMHHGYVPPSSGNHWAIESCTGLRGRGCLWVQGIDANGGMVSNVVYVTGYPGVREFAFVDISLAGTAYYSCHVTGGCGYATRAGQASTTYHSCYSEVGTTSAISSSAMIIGGTMPFHCGKGTAMLDGKLSSIVVGVLPDTHHTYFEPAGNFFRVAFVTQKMIDEKEKITGLIFRMSDAAAEGITGYFEWVHERGIRKIVSMVSDTDTGLSGDPGDLWFPRGFWIGWNGLSKIPTPKRARLYTLDVLDPVSVNLVNRVGNVQFYGDSVPGGYIGWACTEPGTPGTHTTFGEIVSQDLLVKNVSSGTVTLDENECAHRRIRFIGTLTGDVVAIVRTPAVIFPSTNSPAPNSFDKIFQNQTTTEQNQTTKRFVLTLKTVLADPGIELAEGKTQHMWSDGMNLFAVAGPT